MRFTIVILGMFFAFTSAQAQVTSSTADNTSVSDEALVLAAEKMIHEGGYSKAPVATERGAIGKVIAERSGPIADEELSESEIPVQLTATPKAKDSSSLQWRLAASLGFLLIVAGGIFYASRRWKRTTDKGGQKARIEMMHQFHVGPRRSIALIRVAGETMLVGITDHNINMLKSVSLIDDELEGILPKQDFNNFLEDEFSIEDVRSALRT